MEMSIALVPQGMLIDQGYRGRHVSGDKETYYPRMYVVKADTFTVWFVCGFHHSHICNEILGALDILRTLPKKVIAIYDRFYLSKALLQAHRVHGSYFDLSLQSRRVHLHHLR